MKSKLFTFSIQFLIILAAFFVPITALADTAYQVIDKINSYNKTNGGSGSLEAGTTDGATVTVTGILTDVTATLSLNLDSNVTVLWQAEIKNSSSLPQNNPLISLTGTGTFEVDKGIITSSGIYYTLQNIDATVIVSGGTVGSDTDYAIHSSGTNSKVTVCGGTVSGTTVAIEADGTNPSVTVSSGIVSATGMAICSVGTDLIATISGGTVSANAGYGIYSVGQNAAVTVNGGTVSGGNEEIGACVIYLNDASSTLTVSETGIVQAADGSRAILSYGNVNIKDSARVIATTGNAIYLAGDNSNVTVSGGLVFAYGKAVIGIDNVIYAANFTGATGDGVIIAWNQATGHTTYTAGSSDDIAKSPASATAVWGIKGTDNGISYANGTNAGFIPISGVAVTAGTAIEAVESSDINLYSRVGNLMVESEKLAIKSVSVYAVSGQLLKTVEPESNRAVVNGLPGSQALIVKVVRSDGTTMTRKIINS